MLQLQRTIGIAAELHPPSHPQQHRDFFGTTASEEFAPATLLGYPAACKAPISSAGDRWPSTSTRPLASSTCTIPVGSMAFTASLTARTQWPQVMFFTSSSIIKFLQSVVDRFNLRLDMMSRSREFLQRAQSERLAWGKSKALCAEITYPCGAHFDLTVLSSASPSGSRRGDCNREPDDRCSDRIRCKTLLQWPGIEFGVTMYLPVTERRFQRACRLQPNHLVDAARQSVTLLISHEHSQSSASAGRHSSRGGSSPGRACAQQVRRWSVSFATRRSSPRGNWRTDLSGSLRGVSWIQPGRATRMAIPRRKRFAACTATRCQWAHLAPSRRNAVSHHQVRHREFHR